jgi:DNA polymerase-1
MRLLTRHCLVDYSREELRVGAWQMTRPCWQHSRLSRISMPPPPPVLGKPLDQVTKEERRNAKAINFGLIYGMSVFGLTRATELTLAESENFVDTYFRQFPGVKKYLDNTRVQAAQQGYVETLLGRRRYFR